MRTFYVTAVALLIATVSSAAVIETSTRIYSTSSTTVQVGQPSALDTADLTPKTGSFTDAVVTDLLTFGVDHHYYQYFGTAMEVKVKVEIKTYDASNTLLSTDTDTLTINYDPFGGSDYIDKEAHRFTDAYRFSFEIKDIAINGTWGTTTLPANLYLEGSISAERYYNFSTSPISFTDIDTLDLNCDGVNDEVLITWTLTAGAEEYQLEWTFVNDYDQSATGPFLAQSALPYSFRGNATRVTTVYNSYRIPMLFDHGYVIFRLRGVGRDVSDPDTYIFGAWNTAETDTVDDVSSSNKLKINFAHEADLNWQVTTTFAEEGKKKEVITYFDGSLRSRQIVTRINSDNNVIVGETIYDHQGRPAVTVLPAPVADTSCTGTGEGALMYYAKFNQDTSAVPAAYSRTNFDLDVSACEAATEPMGTQAGASNYYSDANTDMEAQQAYVPDAEGFPFVRTEYTPDNTGRIRRQGGVGDDFQLDTTHASKYYYGQPNQLQLDRLFGVEVGDAAHYKKNIVIDPNGQASVSYLDQEGRVVATALAGDEAENTTAIASEGSAADTLLVDLFATDANGNSLLNTMNIQQDAMVFTSQLLVPHEGDYEFDYSLSVDTLDDPCLASNVCFNCIYDLQISITDECGEFPTFTVGDTVNKHVGHFTWSGSDLVFNTTCSGPTSTTASETFTATLPVGNYTVYKILTVNEDAVDFYVEAYLDSTKNTCFKTLHDFEEEYLALVDTSDCYIDCDECVTSLGDRDEWVSSGKGTALEYDIEVEKCEAMCKVLTPCEASYRMMLSDVSPGGQYAQFFNTNTNQLDVSVFPLSVMNSSNILPYTIQTSIGDWHHPLAEVNGTNYAYYLEEDGTRSTINLAVNGSNYIPEVVNTGGTYVFQDAVTGVYYTYPENLADESDFIANWRPSWAQSLVQYHPEYCYYETCREYSEEQLATDVTTSDEFDNLLRSTETFDDAVTAGFIKSTYLSFTDPNDRVEDWFTLSATKPYDPFVTNSSSFGNYGVALQGYFDVYITTGTSNYTMLEAAAMAVRCGNNYATLPTGTCMEFGKDHDPSASAAYNDSIRDLEWIMLRSFYLSAKGELQNDYADEVALDDCHTLNDCIGQGEDYNPITSGMFNFSTLNNSQYFLDGQPCSHFTYMLYAGKQKRFPDAEDLPVASPQDAAYQLYLQTGQCPLAYSLQELLSALAGNNKLDATQEPLMNYPQYNALYLAKYNFAPEDPISGEEYEWTGDVSAGTDTLDIVWTDPNASDDTLCTLRLDKSLTTVSAWDDILGFKNLVSTGVDGSGNYTFSAMAVISSGSSYFPYTYDTITGYISCLQLDSCLFPETCEPSQFAKDLFLLMNALAITGDVDGSAIDVEDPDGSYLPLLTSRIRHLAGPSNSQIEWSYSSGNDWFILEDAAGDTAIILHVLTETPASLSYANIAFFGNLNISYENIFEVDAFEADSDLYIHFRFEALLADASDTTGISMGDCGHPTPMACDQQEHHVRSDLEKLLDEKLPAKPFTGDIDLFQSLNMTPLLQSYLSDSTDTTSSDYATHPFTGYFSDTLTFDIDGCYLTLWHTDDSIPPLPMDSLIALSDLLGIGEADANGNYHDFMVTATYDISGTEYTDTLFGTTCWPLKNCVMCPDTNGFVQGEGESMFSSFGDGGGGFGSFGDGADCESFYESYLDTITAYNNSAWADSAAFYLDTIYYSYEDFVRAGLCTCIESYFGYIGQYLQVPLNHGLALPVNIDDFGECEQTTSVPIDTCKYAYSKYNSAVIKYNNCFSDHPGMDTLSDPYDFQAFSHTGLCYCVDEFVALVDAICEGHYDNDTATAEEKLYFAEACIGKLLPPCRPEIVLDTFVSPSVPYTNPCVEYKINTALANAQAAYNTYVDSLSGAIAAAYRAHCLGATEEFTAEYTDKEYHFTLYYYDQSGNLIKTVPPEGVELLPIDSYLDAAEQQIIADRTNNTQTIFTQHRMATHYEYNSLNQLVRQSMPDMDNMDIWETTLPNGLDSRLKITSTQFVTETRGYLSGYIDIGGGIIRGMVYITDDGGTTWKRFGGEVGADINKIQWISSTVAYAVGDNGTVITTTDGTNWDMLNTFATTTVGGTGVLNNLNDLYFTSSSSGVMVGDNQLMLTTTNSGSTFTMINLSSTLPAAGDDITSVSYDGTNYFITVNHDPGGGLPVQGLIYTSTTLSSWSAQTSVSTAAALKKVQYYNTDSAYACGSDGTLLHTMDNGATWLIVPTSTAGQFTDIFFRNADEGIAIIESGSAGELWKTFDAGITWELLGTAGDDYNALYPYEDIAAGAKVAAVGDDGLVSRVIMQANTVFGVITLTQPHNATDLRAVWAKEINGQLWMYVGGNSAKLYFTTNATASNVAWDSLSTGISSPDLIRMEAMQTSNTTPSNPAVSGVLLNSNGLAYNVHKNDNSTSHSFNAISTPASPNYGDVQPSGVNDTLLLINNADQKIYFFNPQSTTNNTASVLGSGTTGFTTLTTMSALSGDVMLGGSAGTIVNGTYSFSPSTSFSDQSDNLVNVALNVTEYSGSGGQVYAAGADGNILENTSGAWQILPASTAEDLYALNFNTTTTGVTAGENGALLKITVGASSITSTVVSTGTTETIYDVTRSGNVVYAAASNGTLLTCSNISLTTPVVNVATVSTVGDLKGVAFRAGSSTTALAVGEHAHLRWCYAQTSMQNKQVFTPQLNSIHFTDAVNGYIGGNTFTVRYTTDGGMTWNMVMPASAVVTLGSVTPNINTVHAHPDGTASIGGTVRYIGRVSGGTASPIVPSGLPSGSVLNATDFASADADRGVMVGRAGTFGFALTTTDMGVSWTYNTDTIGTTNLRSVKAFYRGTSPTLTYFVGGSNSKLRYWDGSAFGTTACTLPGSFPTVVFTDFYFHDDLNGYLVGTKGTTLKTDAFAYNTTTGVYTAGDWLERPMDDDLLGQTDSTKMGEATVAFSSRYHGFVGGQYDNTSQPSAPVGYARLLRDESDVFSTYFWYDKLGRIVASQNSRQYAETDKRYSYTIYDALGRAKEAGEKYENTSSDPQHRSIFGTYVNNFFNPNVIDDDSLTAWLTESSGIRTEVVHTYYDTVNTEIQNNLPTTFDQENLRKRVVCVTYSDTLDTYDSTYNHATHYTYDIHGNVNTVLQDNRTLATYAPGGALPEQEFRRIDYTYDLISGNVHQVDYETDSVDQMHHRYEYDADNRITDVETSTDNVIWDHDAKYFYYAHGPLARIELGEENSQGIDYAYTLQRWIKGVNSNTLDSTRDIGRDGDTLGTNPNELFAPDVVGYTLNYYNGDYKPIDATNHWTTVATRFEADKASSDLLNNREDFFNGNISAMVTTIMDPSTYEVLPQGMSYSYDQLNRLLSGKAWTNLNVSTNAWGNGYSYANEYYNSFSYDANGNILGQLRYDENGVAIDSMKYRYARDGSGNMLQNRLYHVNDTVTAPFTDDIDDQGTFSSTLATINTANNYGYDGEGRLIRDDQEDIERIVWTVTGKVKEVIRSNGSSKKNLKFDYDAMGMRVAKHIFESDCTWVKSTYYVRDPQGNVMAVYDQQVISAAMSYQLVERDLYGSSRLGITKDSVEMIGSTLSTDTFTHIVGKKQYELSNHLGNVLAVISDMVIPQDWNSDTNVDSWRAEIVSATDYYAFGAPMAGRTFSSANYRYAFNGKEKDDEIHGNSGTEYDFGARMYDARLGRFLSIDPLFKNFPHKSNYSAFNNCPLIFIDPSGMTEVSTTSNTSTESVAYVKSAVNDHNETILTYVKVTKTTTVNTDGSKVVTTVMETQSNKVYNGDQNTDDYKDPLHGNTLHTQTTVENYGPDGLLTGTYITEKDQTVDNTTNTELESWTQSVHKYNSDPEYDRRTYNQMIYEDGMKLTSFAFALGQVPLIGIGVGAIQLPLWLSATLNVVNLSASIQDVNVLGNLVLSPPDQYSIIMGVEYVKDGVLQKQMKTPDSKDKKYIGPTSFEELFDLGKLKEWWYADEDADK